MIIMSLCNSCLQPYQVLVEPSDIPLIKQIADDTGHTCPCPRLCGGVINLVGDDTINAMVNDRRLKESVRITGKELYQAINGLGLPDEVPASFDTVEAMLRAFPTEKVVMQDVHGKVYLHEIHLKNEVVIHLGSGAHGAQVLKMTKKRRIQDGVGNHS